MEGVRGHLSLGDDSSSYFQQILVFHHRSYNGKDLTSPIESTRCVAAASQAFDKDQTSCVTQCLSFKQRHGFIMTRDNMHL